MHYYNGYVPVSISKSIVDLYNSYISYPKIEANLISLANYTLNTKNVKDAKYIIEKIKQEQKITPYIFIDSGGYQSKVGRLNKDNYKKHLDTYLSLIDLLEDNMFLFSMDFPPCIKDNISNGIDGELSAKLTTESYTEIAKNFKHKKDKLIMIVHFALLPVFTGWYKMFEQLQDDLRDFKHWATGLLSKNYSNPKVISYYHAAKLFLMHFNIVPERFHFLGTNVLPLIKPMYDDKDLMHRSFDTTIVAYTGDLSLLRKRVDGLYEINTISFKDTSKYQIDQYIDTFSEYIDKSLSKELSNLFSWRSKKRMEKELVKFAIILQLHANLMKGKLLEQNLLYINNMQLGIDRKQEQMLIKLDKIKYEDLLFIVKHCDVLAN